MENHFKSASPSEPRRDHAKEKCQSCICYEHLLHLIQLAVCDPHEAVKGNLPSKAKAVEMIIDRAEPRRDEREAFEIEKAKFAVELSNYSGMCELAEKPCDANAFNAGWHAHAKLVRAARASAAPLKQTDEIGTCMEFPALHPYNVHCVNWKPSQPQPSAGHFNKTCSECGAWPGDRHEANCSEGCVPSVASEGESHG